MQYPPDFASVVIPQLTTLPPVMKPKTDIDPRHPPIALFMLLIAKSFGVFVYGKDYPGIISAGSSASEHWLIKLSNEGLLEPKGPNSNMDYALTKKGKVFVEALCDLKLPVQTWVMPSTIGDNDE